MKKLILAVTVLAGCVGAQAGVMLAAAAENQSGAGNPADAAGSAPTHTTQQGQPVASRVDSLEKKLVEMQRAYEARIAALEAEVAALKGARGTGTAPGAATAAGPSPGQPSPSGSVAAAPPAGASVPAPPSAAGTPVAALPPPPPAPSGSIPPAPPAAPAGGPPVAEAVAPVAAPAEAPPAPEAPPPAAAPSQTSSYFNPSISVIGNFLAVGGSNPQENLPAASLRESEVSFQAIVDPYARADFFLSFGEEGVNVEEGFVTFTSLPWGLLAKVGRMRTTFGKINTLHLHVLPWPDEPLPLVNLVGGEEGWIGSGGSIAKMIPLPGDVVSEATVQVFDGNAGELFSAPKRGDISYNGHYRIFSDLSESTNLDFGLSYGEGPNGITETSRTRLEAVDATLRWKPLRTATYRSASFRGEFIRSRKGELTGTQTADGWFLSGEYQFAKRWFTGARYERSEHADDASLHDSGEALLLTFWPSEFSQIRGELRRRMYASGLTADEILLQIQFAIGAHGAHPF